MFSWYRVFSFHYKLKFFSKIHNEVLLLVAPYFNLIYPTRNIYYLVLGITKANKIFFAILFNFAALSPREIQCPQSKCVLLVCC